MLGLLADAQQVPPMAQAKEGWWLGKYVGMYWRQYIIPRCTFAMAFPRIRQNKTNIRGGCPRLASITSILGLCVGLEVRCLGQTGQEGRVELS